MSANQHLATSFSEKEHANISRKVAQAKHYISFRDKMSGVDSTNESIHASEIQLNAEADAIAEYESCKILVNSINSALSFLQSLQSRIAQMETRYQPKQ
jgi:hypothetical protein